MIILDIYALIFIPLIIYILTKHKLLTILTFLFCIRFLNSPDLKLQRFETNIFYSPTSGYVRSIENRGETTNISLFLNVFDNHTQYIPITSELRQSQKFSGLFLPAYNEHSVNNERVKHTLYSSEFDFEYTITQITGLLTRRILSLRQPKQNVVLYPGERLGFIILGSRVDISIPTKNIDKLFINSDQHINALDTLLIVKK